MNPDFASFLSVLRNPSRMPELSEAAWDLLLRQAAQSGLLGRLGALAQQEGLTERLPKCVQHGMQSALTVAKQQHRAVLWELVQLTKTLSQLKGPVILLKGAAYTAANLAPSHGRLFLVGRVGLEPTTKGL
jgi:hypothetical protein